MKLFLHPEKSLLLAGLLLSAQGCAMQWGADIQWDSRDQILMSEKSQVKMRAIQTEVFDTTDRMHVIRAVIDTMQDLYFTIDVLDPALGVISGQKIHQSGSVWQDDPTYYRYDTDSLIIFSMGVYRTYGPFQYRNDLTRLTVTIRPRGETQLLVRASVQYELEAVQDPEFYQKYFALLRQSLFLAAEAP